MRKLPFVDQTFSPPLTVTVEASSAACVEYDLSVTEGEHYDTVENVVAVHVETAAVEFETARSINAWLRGEPNAGRGTYRIPRAMLEAMYVAD
jgi:hypothetical protein